MDPTKCWKEIQGRIRILQALEHPGGPMAAERELLIENLRDLADWLQKGGFVPQE